MLKLLSVKRLILPHRSNCLGFSAKQSFLFSNDPKTNSSEAAIKKTQNKTFFQKYFGPETYTTSPYFKNRWLVVIPCFISNLCIGSPYAWSMVAGK